MDTGDLGLILGMSLSLRFSARAKLKRGEIKSHSGVDFRGSQDTLRIAAQRLCY